MAPVAAVCVPVRQTDVAVAGRDNLRPVDATKPGVQLLAGLDEARVGQRQKDGTDVVAAYWDLLLAQETDNLRLEFIDANTPNWFYYWRKGGVIQWVWDGANHSMAADDFRFLDVSGLGDYNMTEQQLYVFRDAAGSYSASGIFRNHLYNTYLRTDDTGRWNWHYVPVAEGDDFVLNTNHSLGGEPDAVAIIPAVGETTLDTWPTYGDDEFDTVTIGGVDVNCVTTGPNGILQTTKKGTDRMIVYTHPVDGDPDTIDEPEYDGGPNGGGKPWAIAITAGTNGYMESANDGDTFNPTGLGWLDWSEGMTFHYAGTWNDIDLVVRACGDAVTSRTLFDELLLRRPRQPLADHQRRHRQLSDQQPQPVHRRGRHQLHLRRQRQPRL